MPKELYTEIVIDAPPSKVWSVLTDFVKYESWNPFIKLLTGTVQVGNIIQVIIQPPSSKKMKFTPKVLSFETNKELSWLGSLFFKGLFDGLHKFELIDLGNGKTKFIQSEKFSGLLVSMINLGNTKKGFEAMNQKLKEISEEA